MSGDDYTQQLGQDQLDRLHNHTALEHQPVWPPTYFPQVFSDDLNPLTPLSAVRGAHHAPAVDDIASPPAVGACVPITSKER